MTWNPHANGMRVIDRDGEIGTVVKSKVDDLHPCWFMAQSRVTTVSYDDGNTKNVIEFDDEDEPMLTEIGT